MRIMIDTNIFISAILFPDSIPSKLVEKVKASWCGDRKTSNNNSKRIFEKALINDIWNMTSDVTE